MMHRKKMYAHCTISHDLWAEGGIGKLCVSVPSTPYKNTPLAMIPYINVV